MCQWTSIVAILISFISAIGIWVTSSIIERVKDSKIVSLQQDVQNLEVQTRDTVFTAGNEKTEVSGNGKYDFSFTLTPEGKNIIPILHVAATTSSGSIENIRVAGPSIPPFSEHLSKKNDPIWLGIRYSNVIPQILTVTISTTSDPRTNPLKIEVVPLASNK